MALIGKQKRVLRGIGQRLDPSIFIGKEGVSEATVMAVEEAFRRHELLKVRVLNNAPELRDVISAALTERTGSDIAGAVGHTFLLYRPNPELKHRIELPPAKTGDA